MRQDVDNCADNDEQDELCAEQAVDVEEGEAVNFGCTRGLVRAQERRDEIAWFGW